jgi:hypothetical protein
VIGEVWEILAGLGFLGAWMREIANAFSVRTFSEAKNVLVLFLGF